MTATLVRVAARKKKPEPSAAGYSVSEVSSALGCVGSGASSIGDDLEPGQTSSRPVRPPLSRSVITESSLPPGFDDGDYAA